MKNKMISIIMLCLFILFGLMVGAHLNINEEIKVVDFSSSINRQVDAAEINRLRNVVGNLKTQINEIETQIEEIERERASESMPLKKLRGDVSHYKLLAGHVPVVGEGIIITLKDEFGANIADVMEGQKYLVRLINELRVFGAEAISLNNHRISGRTEIIFAGNHINVNGFTIAPPYEIKAIGNVNSFRRYTEFRTLIFELMELDGVQSYIEFSDSVEIPKVTREKPMSFFRLVED